MGLHVLLVGKLRPDLGVAGRHDGLPVADVRHLDAVQSAVAEFGADGALFVSCLREDLAEVRRCLALVSVGLPGITTVLEPVFGSPLAVAVGSALVGGAGPEARTEQQLAAFDLMRSTLWSAVWLPRVSKLADPSPSMMQHVRSWVPGGGFLAVYDSSPRVVRAGNPPLKGLERAPKGAMLVTADSGAPSWVRQHLASAVHPLSTAELRSWRNPADAFGVAEAGEYVLVPAQLLEIAKLTPDVVTNCRGCGIRHPRPVCPFCGMAVVEDSGPAHAGMEVVS